ncbi:MAG: enolase C-terminal domain-like protein [Acidobacteriota bacterium]|nr:hypothetical protein [Blastocatellia bacterium]MDW8240960.1 enolase C-terminal domain-like protein [Acidobacteriota bacterium]
MKIIEVRAIPVSIAVKPEMMIISAGGEHRVSRYALVAIHTDAEITGWGEAAVMPAWSGETQRGACALIEDEFASKLLHRDPFDLESLMAELDRVCEGNLFTKSAIEMALLDIIGKALKVPLYRLLGGRCRDAKLPIKFTIGAVAADQAAALASRMVRCGFRAIKVKVGLDTQQDLARVKAVREAIGSDVMLTVDANGGWSVKEAIHMIRELEPYRVALVEQPVDRCDLVSMAEVRKAVAIPIMADEAVFTEREALEVIRLGAADVISIYPGKNGGILKARSICKMAEAAGLACHIGSNLEWDLGASAMCHLAVSTAAIASEKFPGDIIGPLYHVERPVKNPLRIENGFAEVGDGPGLGIDVAEDKLAELRARESATPPGVRQALTDQRN